ncbi:MAG: phage holin family protein [Actinomycetota bacterium]|nr:phage holin family protein [Actinomycetota bacterium]
MTRPTSESSASEFPDGGGQPAQGDSLGELIGRISRDLATLVRQELELATAELRREALNASKGAGLLGAAGFAGYMVVLFLSIALWWALANVMDEGWAALLVATLWGAVAGLLYPAARRQLRELRLKPERTVETVKEVPDALKGHRGDHHGR